MNVFCRQPISSPGPYFWKIESHFSDIHVNRGDMRELLLLALLLMIIVGIRFVGGGSYFACHSPCCHYKMVW
jgi:hypothetical protein